MGKQNCIVVIDDEEDILELLEYNLIKEGYRVISIPDGKEGLETVRELVPDLIILDLMLPGLHGLDLCRIIKNDKYLAHIPIVMLTAKGEEEDIVTGLELGADDYITKPFSIHVLIARVRAVLRRSIKEKKEPVEKPIEMGRLKIEPEFYRVTLDNNALKLTPTEFELLRVMVENEGKVFTRKQLLGSIEGGSVFVTNRTVDVHLTSLRKKLGDMGGCIETVRGVGYRFKSGNEQG